MYVKPGSFIISLQTFFGCKSLFNTSFQLPVCSLQRVEDFDLLVEVTADRQSKARIKINLYTTRECRLHLLVDIVPQNNPWMPYSSVIVKWLIVL